MTEKLFREILETLPHQRYDIVSKDIFGTFPEELLRQFTKIPELKFIEQLDTELPTVEVRRMDILAKVLIDDQEVLVHIEFQVSSESASEIVKRKIGYFGDVLKNMGCRFCLTRFILMKMLAGMTPGGIVKSFQGII